MERSWTEINLSNFEHNFNELKRFLRPGINTMQIVKADAYGHGAYQISRKAIACGAVSLGVANSDEGALLRYQGISVQILVLSPSLDHEIESIIEYDLTPSISYLDFAKSLNDYCRKRKIICKVHVNVDTGMGRSGFNLDKALVAYNQIKKMPNLKIEGIFSHYSASEENIEYTAHQKKVFNEFLDKLKELPPSVHIANSSAVINAADDFSTLVRIGLLSYGIYSDKSIHQLVDLRPVMSFKTRISLIKSAEYGESIGYNRTYIATEKVLYAILPIGYADGYDYLLSNKGYVLISGNLCPVIGRISMDMIAVNISGLDDVHVNDEVILLGEGHERLRAENITALYGGSCYEILCQIGRRAKRYYRENGSTIASSPLLRRDFVSFDYSDGKLNTIIEAAIEQRLQSKQIASLIYKDVLERLFTEKDQKIGYRRNFNHTIRFSETKIRDFQDYFQVNTSLTFTKKLQNDYFYVVCAKNELVLEKYFLRKDVEYRWLLNENFDLGKDFFDITDIRINKIELNTELKIVEGCLEIRCYHSQLADLVDQEVKFSISTRTYYPKNSHQVAVYLIEMTQGAEIQFIYDDLINNIEVVSIFSGKNRYPLISKESDRIKVTIPKDRWILPNSGVVFVY
ncbi:MAG: alanine racemase [Candidatus Cloacimonetes bacterium]|nr:alanine racemase [Candidatus Cloacimonadota bacterium]